MSELRAGWYETVSSQVRYEGFSTVRVDSVRMPDGDEAEREIVEHDDAVAVVAVTTDERVLLLRQYRHAIGRYVLEIPAGKLDVDGEAVEDAARRELAEELAYDAPTLLPLVTFMNSVGWCTEHTHVLLATGCTAGRVPDGFTAEAEEADMEVVSMTVDEAMEAARTGVIVDSKSLIGLLLAEPHLTG